MERKTLDQRAQMIDLERLRHSAAHVMATTFAKLWPEAQYAAGSTNYLGIGTATNIPAFDYGVRLVP